MIQSPLAENTIQSQLMGSYIKDRVLWELKNLWILVFRDNNNLHILKTTPYRVQEPENLGITQFWIVLHHARTMLKLLDVSVIPLSAYDKDPEKYLENLYELIEGLTVEAIVSKLDVEKFVVTNAMKAEGTSLRKGKVIDLLLWFSLPSIAFHKFLVYESLNNGGLNLIKFDLLKPRQPKLEQKHI
jgi:hypothetical protein